MRLPSGDHAGFSTSSSSFKAISRNRLPVSTFTIVNTGAPLLIPANTNRFPGVSQAPADARQSAIAW
jgi:hypothetical protein